MILNVYRYFTFPVSETKKKPNELKKKNVSGLKVLRVT